MPMQRICEMSLNNKNDLHLNVLKIHIVKTKNGKCIYKTLLSDGLERISCTEFGYSKFSKFKEDENIYIVNFTLKRSEINNYYLKLNEKDLEIMCNFSTKINSSKEKISALEYTDLETISILQCVKNHVFNLKGVVVNFKNSTVNNKSRSFFKLIDIDHKKTINCIFWQFDDNLCDYYEYEFLNVQINTNDGYNVTKLWCSRINKLKKCKNKVELNKFEDISKSKIICNKILLFENIVDDKPSFVEIIGNLLIYNLSHANKTLLISFIFLNSIN
jgi:hypothetical protein